MAGNSGSDLATLNLNLSLLHQKNQKSEIGIKQAILKSIKSSFCLP